MTPVIVMEVTVNAYTSPLLYERLRACATRRERAAVLRACAEAHLRGESMRAATGSDGATGPCDGPPPGAAPPHQGAAVALDASASSPISLPVASSNLDDELRTGQADRRDSASPSFPEDLGGQLSSFFS